MKHLTKKESVFKMLKNVKPSVSKWIWKTNNKLRIIIFIPAFWEHYIFLLALLLRDLECPKESVAITLFC